MNIKNDIKISKNKYIYQRYNGIIMEYIENDDYYINTETGISIKKDSQILLGEISKNIVDLIEIGDFVNKGYVYEIGYTELGEKWIHTLNGLLLFEEDVESILTHEQYEQNSFKLGGKGNTVIDELNKKIITSEDLQYIKSEILKNDKELKDKIIKALEVVANCEGMVCIVDLKHELGTKAKYLDCYLAVMELAELIKEDKAEIIFKVGRENKRMEYFLKLLK